MVVIRLQACGWDNMEISLVLCIDYTCNYDKFRLLLKMDIEKKFFNYNLCALKPLIN